MTNRNGEPPDPTQFAAERGELETVLESGIFAPSSNAAKLLRFVCEKHFANAAEAMTEHDVAVKALGRRPDFDARSDSIVRVEAHRVRKRLQEYYEVEGASHSVRIVLPRGQYAPQFMHAEGIPAGAPPVRPEDPGARNRMRGAWRLLAGLKWRLLATAAIVIALIAASMWMGSLPARRAEDKKVSEIPTLAPGDTVRILAGLLSGEHLDKAGNRWSADMYYTGGEAREARYYSLALADDPAIYRHARTGQTFSYDIPLRPGIYEMRLMFAESGEVAILGSVGDGTRSFHVTANGVQILPPVDDRHMRALDILADSGGSDTADIKVFKDISPASDGKLHLKFISRNQPALLNAIEIVPGLKGRMRPLRWRANETPYTDHAGNLWLADRYYRGGRLSRFHAIVSGTPDPALYETERFGSFTYQIPVVASGSYTVTMHFAENYFGGWAPKVSPPRRFAVYVNHLQYFRDLDVSREAGGPTKALTKVFRGVKASVFDKIVLNFEPCTDYAIVNAIEVEDETR